MASEKAEGGLAGRYANAVFELAQDQKAIDAVSTDLARLVRSPVFSAEDQAKALKAILEKMGAHPLTAKFVLLLAHKRRLSALLQAIAAFEHMVAKSRGEMEAEVTSARHLNDDEIAELKSVLKTGLGKEPRLHSRIDPTLLGGLIVKIGSRMIDSSLRTKLDSLRVAMKG